MGKFRNKVILISCLCAFNFAVGLILGACAEHSSMEPWQRTAEFWADSNQECLKNFELYKYRINREQLTCRKLLRDTAFNNRMTYE